MTKFVHYYSRPTVDWSVFSCWKTISKSLWQYCVLSLQAVELADRQREESAEADGSDGQGPMTAVLVPPHRVSVMWTAWVFFKTFFSSLIPEVPQGIDNWPPETDDYIKKGTVYSSVGNNNLWRWRLKHEWKDKDNTVNSRGEKNKGIVSKSTMTGTSQQNPGQ